MEKEMYYGYIYVTLDQKHNKVYVGQKTGKPEQSKLYCGSGTIIQTKIKSRGTYFLKKTVLGEVCTTNKKELKKLLNEAEIECISFFDSYNPIYGYNLVIGGEGAFGYHHSEEAKEKIRAYCTGRKLTENAKKKLSESRIGIIFSEEHKQNMSKSRKGENNPLYGKKHSEETKKKMSESMTGVKHKKPTKEMIKRRVDSRKGYTHSEETKKKISNSNKGKVKSEETRKKQADSLRGFSVSEETKKKISGTMKDVCKNRPTIICPYCGREGIKNNMSTHINNCKLKYEKPEEERE